MAGTLRDWRRAAAFVLLVLIGASLLAATVAAATYPGGSWIDRTAVGHSLWANFLCDIARDVALDGAPHPGARWGRAAEWGLVLALLLFWQVTPALHAPRSERSPVPLLGGISTAGLLLVPVTTQAAHVGALLLGAGPGLVAAGLVLRGLRARPALFWLGVVALLLSALELGLFLAFLLHPFPLAVPAVQRLAVAAAAAWMASCAVVVLRDRR